MDTSEFANLVERLIELKLSLFFVIPQSEAKNVREQIQLTKEGIQGMVDAR